MRCDSYVSCKQGCYIEAGEDTCCQCVDLNKACLFKGQAKAPQAARNSFYYPISAERPMSVKSSSESRASEIHILPRDESLEPTS